MTEPHTIWPSTASRTCSSSWSDMATVGEGYLQAAAVVGMRVLESTQTSETDRAMPGFLACASSMFSCWRMVDVACPEA
jgi:hypothetical protein